MCKKVLKGPCDLMTRAVKVSSFTDSSSLPEGDVPSLEQDFSVLLPHLQQHVEQL